MTTENLKPHASWTWLVSEISLKRADKILSNALECGKGQWALSTNEASPSISRNQIQKLIDENRVWVNGLQLTSTSKLKIGDQVLIELPKPKSLEIIPEDRPLEILFQDEHLVVINKPPGLTVHPSTTQMEGTLVHALLHHIKDLSGIGGTLRPGIVHRLDKDTSGALVITKTDRAHQALVDTFSKHDIQRIYWALTYGAPADNKEFKIESLIGRNPTDRKKMSMQVTKGRRAVSWVSKLEQYHHSHSATAFAAMMAVRLETGRTHQVRVHLTGKGFSLLGDPVYGTPTQDQSKWKNLPEEIQALVSQLPGQALHARALGFLHPVTGKDLYFEAEPPALFSELLKQLRNYLGPTHGHQK